MFNAFKKWTRGSEEKSNMPSGVRTMGQALQRKFARGVQYNMKLVIKGDRNVGKSCLLHRLQGKAFSEQYLPTSEIQVASIHWNYRATDDIVKVEVWDVVDKGKSKKRHSTSLKIENDEVQVDGDTILDAEFLDVYKGTNGVIMMLDITKPWTFQYAQRELPKVPNFIPVLVLANHRDMGEHRLVETEEIARLIESLQRPSGSSPVLFAEASMKNGFGLKYIHKFFNLPFLLLQREALMKQLQVNAVDLESTLEELHIHKESEEQDYDKFQQVLTKRKAEHEAKLAAEAEAKLAAATAESETKPSSPETSLNHANSQNVEKADPEANHVSLPNEGSTAPNPPSSIKERFSRKIFSSGASKEKKKGELIPRRSSALTPDIEEFHPDDELDAGFLAEEGNARNKNKPVKNPKSVSPQMSSSESDDSDGDIEGGNPMVSGFAEDLDDDDLIPSTKHPVSINHSIDQSDDSDVPEPQLTKPLKPMNIDVQDLSSSEEDSTNIEEQKNKKEEESKKKVKKSKEKPVELVINQPTEDFGFGAGSVDDWLNSPDLEPKAGSLISSKETQHSLRKVDINVVESVTTPPSATSMDEWSLFMEQQLQSNSAKSSNPAIKTNDILISDDNEGEETKIHRKKSTKSKHKHRKHRTKVKEENQSEEKEEKKKSRHKDSDKERRKSKEDDISSEHKKKHKKHQKKFKEQDSKEPTYETL